MNFFATHILLPRKTFLSIENYTMSETKTETKTIDYLLSRKVLQAIESQGGRKYVEEELIFDKEEMQFQEDAFHLTNFHGWVWWDNKHHKKGEITVDDHKKLFNKAMAYYQEMIDVDVFIYHAALCKHRVVVADETKAEIEDAMNLMVVGFTYDFGIESDTDLPDDKPFDNNNYDHILSPDA